MKQKKIVSMIGALIIMISAVVLITGCSQVPTPEPAPNPKSPVPDEPEIESEDVPIPRLPDGSWITLSNNENYLIIRWYVKSIGI